MNSELARRARSSAKETGLWAMEEDYWNLMGRETSPTDVLRLNVKRELSSRGQYWTPREVSWHPAVNSPMVFALRPNPFGATW